MDGFYIRESYISSFVHSYDPNYTARLHQPLYNWDYISLTPVEIYENTSQTSQPLFGPLPKEQMH